MQRRLLVVFGAMLLVGIALPAGANSHDFVESEYQVGFFYGTFGEDPNVALLAGGRAEDFCEDNPDDPFGASPGVAVSRTFVNEDGSVNVRVNDSNQPIHLYYIGADEDGPTWINRVCDEDRPPRPFASGRATLVVHETFAFAGGPPVHIFNAVDGHARGDGTLYKVRGSADIPFEDGVPVGIPPEWVDFDLVEIER